MVHIKKIFKKKKRFNFSEGLGTEEERKIRIG